MLHTRNIPNRLMRASVLGASLILAACGGSDNSDTLFEENSLPSPSPSVAATPTPTTTVEATATPTVTPVPTVSATPTPTPTITPTPTPATFAEVQAIFNTNCTVACHNSGEGQAGLRLDTGMSYAELVNVTSSQSSNFLRVDPGDADSSYIILKVDPSTAGRLGGQMPAGGRDPLSADDIATIRSWIDAGALEAPASVMKPGAARVQDAVVIHEQDSLEIVISLSGALDAGSLSDGAVLLYLIDGGVATLASPARYSVSVSNDTLVVTVANMESDAVFELHVNDPALSAVLDQNGWLLDGDADGQEGGKYIFAYPGFTESGFTIQ